MSAASPNPPDRRPLNICIASPEFIGPSGQGDAAIACTVMAQALAASGHGVTCLFLGAKDPSNLEWQRWVEKYRDDGLALVALPQIKASELVAPSNLIKSYEAFHWLKRNDRFDIIHFPEKDGPGYHTLTAKHHGLAFKRATICIGLHTMTAFLQTGPQTASDPSEVNTSFMERRSVSLADAVIRSNDNLVNWVSGPHPEMPAAAPARRPAPAAESNISIDSMQAAIHALSIDPTNALALKILARMHLSGGLPEAAEEACQLILKNDPQDPEALQMMEEARAWESRLAGNIVDTQAGNQAPAETAAPPAIEPLEPGLGSSLACS